MRFPRVHAKTSFSSFFRKVPSVQNRKRKSETGFHFFAPLFEHRRRTGHHDPVHSAP